MASVPDKHDSGTLDPLPPVLQRGLIAVGFFGSLSFLSSCLLFLYLSFKLLNWKRKGQLDNGCNQFLLLIYNLLLADMQQAVAFSLTFVTLNNDRIDANMPACWAEGWFVSTGDLASSMFIFAIALHTFFAVVKGRRLPTRVFAAGILGLWGFIYAMAVIPLAMHPGDLYDRAGAWVSQHIYAWLLQLTLAVLD